MKVKSSTYLERRHVIFRRGTKRWKNDISTDTLNAKSQCNDIFKNAEKDSCNTEF